MKYRDFVKLERLPTVWCPGCGNGIALKQTAEAILESGFKKEDTVVVSGIGCAGRGAGYFRLDSVHGLHGRAIPLAEGIKITNPELNVIVFSGDGDLLSIGGNHLLHASRRNTNIKVICIDNQTYGMTGGQTAPTTKRGEKTISSPRGNPFSPLNTHGILCSNDKFFYARTTVFHFNHMKECIKESLRWKGFSFVEIISNCTRNRGRRIGFENAYEMLIHLRDNFKIATSKERLENNEIGVVKK